MVIPYVVFNGNCKDAIAFYQKVFRSDGLKALPYGDYVPEGIETPPANLCDWIMHAEMQICGANFWFADEVRTDDIPVGRISGAAVRLTVTVPTAAIGKEYFDQLKEGGQVTLFPTETFYSTFHAAITDSYGIGWNIVAEEMPQQV